MSLPFSGFALWLFLSGPESCFGKQNFSYLDLKTRLAIRENQGFLRFKHVYFAQTETISFVCCNTSAAALADLFRPIWVSAPATPAPAHKGKPRRERRSKGLRLFASNIRNRCPHKKSPKPYKSLRLLEIEVFWSFHLVDFRQSTRPQCWDSSHLLQKPFPEISPPPS